MSRLPRLLLVSALVLAGVGCGADGSGGTPADDGAATPAAGEPAEASEADRTIEVLARDDLSFQPRSFEVSVGEVVTFEVTNRGALDHDFVIGDQEAQREHAAEMEGASRHAAHDAPNAIVIPPGETREITWRFTRAGVLLAGCHEPGHYSGGMVATITVSDG